MSKLQKAMLMVSQIAPQIHGIIRISSRQVKHLTQQSDLMVFLEQVWYGRGDTGVHAVPEFRLIKKASVR